MKNMSWSAKEKIKGTHEIDILKQLNHENVVLYIKKKFLETDQV